MEYINKILIVDDEPVGRETLGALLLAEGYHLTFASNGEEALEKAADLLPDLILLDVMMPGLDGFEVCRCLRTDPLLAEVPIIMVTALDDRDSRLQGIEAGADDFVTKPFDRIELRTRVRSITRLNRYRRLLLERIYRQEAEAEIHRRNYELTLLNHVVTATASILNVEDVLYVACEALTQAFELPQATTMLLDHEQGQFTVVTEYSAGWADKGLGQRSDQEEMGNEEIPLVGHLALASLLAWKVPMAVIEGQIEPWSAQIQHLMREYQVGSLLIVPILIGNEVIGIIELKTAERHRFSDQDLALAQSIATAIGQPLETARLYQRLQRHIDELVQIISERTIEFQTERDRLQAILNAWTEALVVTDQDGAIQYANSAVLAQTGYDSDELVGRTWPLYPDEDQLTEFYTHLQAATATGHIWSGPVVNHCKDGTLCKADLMITPLFDPHQPGRFIGYISVHKDGNLLQEVESLATEFISPKTS